MAIAVRCSDACLKRICYLPDLAPCEKKAAAEAAKAEAASRANKK